MKILYLNFLIGGSGRDREIKITDAYYKVLDDYGDASLYRSASRFFMEYRTDMNKFRVEPIRSAK